MERGRGEGQLSVLQRAVMEEGSEMHQGGRAVLGPVARRVRPALLRIENVAVVTGRGGNQLGGARPEIPCSPLSSSLTAILAELRPGRQLQHRLHKGALRLGLQHSLRCGNKVMPQRSASLSSQLLGEGADELLEQ